MSLWISECNGHLLLESVVPEFDQYLRFIPFNIAIAISR
jgi:hypothetical protein